MKEGKPISILSNGVHIPPKLCQMTFEHFNGVFEVFIQDPGLTYEEAYEMLEQAHKQIFGNRRYSSYDAFRVVRSRKING